MKKRFIQWGGARSLPLLAAGLVALVAVCRTVVRDRTAASPGEPQVSVGAERPTGLSGEAQVVRSLRAAHAVPGLRVPLPITPGPPERADRSWAEPMVEPVFERFRRWTEHLPAAGDAVALRAGRELALERRQALLELIQTNPRRALELTVPHTLRQRLPEEIKALLEERVDTRGDLLVESAILDGDRGCVTTQVATLPDGRTFETFAYGRRGVMPTRDRIAIHGVALDGKLALADAPGRILETTELASKLGEGIAMESGAGPRTTRHGTDGAVQVVVLFGDDRMTGFPDEDSAVAALFETIGDEASDTMPAGAGDLDGVIAASPWTEGRKSLLIIRVDFPDSQGEVVGNATLEQLIADMNALYTDMSCGKASFALAGQGSAITPTLRMPKSSSNYSSWTSLSKVLDDARAIAAAAGYSHLDYTHEVVVTGAVPLVAGTAGVARLGARGAWLHNAQWNLKTCAHEVGHNFGLPHSGAWDTDDGSVIGPGQAWDYGNVFDMMGVGPSPHASRHFGASLKEFLEWIPGTDVVRITTNGATTTRIRAMDKIQADGNQRALAVDRAGSSDDYWIEHRQLYGTNHGMRDGVLVNRADIRGGYQQPLLLDMRPDTSEKTDAVLSIGRTFSDDTAGIHITPVARGTDPDGVNWIDVRVNRGITAGNLKPVATLASSTPNPALNAGVTFTAAASDPNGDSLAYFWDWGDGTTTANNSPTAVKSWGTAGIKTVVCTVSDMKGLTTTAVTAVQVGAGTSFFIDGTVRSIQGAPLQGVVVRASPTQSDTTDGNGHYVITGLAAGAYTLTASVGAPEEFVNPVTVGPSRQGMDFVRISYPLTWDADAAVAGAQDGGGVWASGAGNWHNATSGANNQKWGNANLDPAIFGAGGDGSHAVTLSGTVQAGGGVTFAGGTYLLSGAALVTHDGTNNCPIHVAAGKSATIQSLLTYLNNKPAPITVEEGATLHLGGGASNSQYNFNGPGTIRLSAGAYQANVGSIGVANFEHDGGTFNITPGNNLGYHVSSTSRSVNLGLSGTAVLTVNGNNTAPAVNNAYLGVGNGTIKAHSATVTVKDEARVEVGTTAGRSGEIRIATTAASNGTLDVRGGTVTVGTGGTDNRIWFFKAGSDADYTATMNQSGGTVRSNGIRFGGDTGSHDPAASAILRLSGGSLFLGAQGISRGSAAEGLPVSILLEGGTLGADQNWSSAMDMRFGSTDGGPVIRSDDGAGTGRNIHLSGKLSNMEGTAGILVKSGMADLVLSGSGNTYSGGTIVRSGRLFIANAGALPPEGEVRVNSGATLDLNADGNPAFESSIRLDPGARLALRKPARLGDVILPAAGLVVLNSDDQDTTAFQLGRDHVLGGDLTVQVGGGPGAPGKVTLTGVVSGNGGIRKTQSGTLILTGRNTYRGATTVSAGTLALAAGGTASAITVESSGRLELTLGTTITSSASLALAPGHAIVVAGTPSGSVHTLFATSGSITGTPQLANPIGGHRLMVQGGNQLLLVRDSASPYELWSGGRSFDADANADGVSNGLAFLLGAPDAGSDARGLLPVHSRSDGDLILTFTMRNAAHRGAAMLALQHSADLGRADPWTKVLVPDAGGGTGAGVSFIVRNGDPLDTVTAIIAGSEAANGRLFGRLEPIE